MEFVNSYNSALDGCHMDLIKALLYFTLHYSLRRPEKCFNILSLFLGSALICFCVKLFMGYQHPAFPFNPKVNIGDSVAVMFFLLAPLQAPDLIRAYNSSSTSLLIKWSHLSFEHFQGEPIGYNITHQSMDVEGGIHFVQVNHTTNTTTLSSLAIYTTYVINVSAVSSGGRGPANMAKARTDAEGVVVLHFISRAEKIFCPPNRKMRLCRLYKVANMTLYLHFSQI